MTNREFIRRYQQRQKTMSTLAKPSATATAISAIDIAAKDYASARSIVSSRVDFYNTEIATVNRRRVPGIKSACAEAADAQAKLAALIQEHADLFVQPRTMTLHGIRVGFAKGKGSIEWADDEKVAEKIRHLLPDQFDTLVKTTHKPLAAPMKNLDVATLRKLGCTIEETGDFVVVKASDTAVDKLVAKILKEGAIEEVEAT